MSAKFKPSQIYRNRAPKRGECNLGASHALAKFALRYHSFRQTCPIMTAMGALFMLQALLEFEPKFISPKRVAGFAPYLGFIFLPSNSKALEELAPILGFSTPPSNSKVLCVFAPYFGLSSLPSYTQAPLPADLPSRLILGTSSSKFT